MSAAGCHSIRHATIQNEGDFRGLTPFIPSSAKHRGGFGAKTSTRGVSTGMPVISLTVNNRAIQLDVDPETPLLWVLRDHLNLVGPKFGCGGSFCGACTVHLDGTAVRSGSVPVGKAVARRVNTIEGLTANGEPAKQRAWEEIDVPQCGYCQGGQIMSCAALLARTSNPSDEEITAAMNGNICRCGTYVRIREAVRRAT